MTFAAEQVAVSYGARAALLPTSFAAARGEFVALVGPNGAGKSSLLKALAGLLPHPGRVLWEGSPLATLDQRQRARLVAYLPQAPALHWPLLSRDLVALGRLPHRAYGAAVAAADDEAIGQTETTAFAARSVAELSVGERARVLLARALAVRAPVLLVDEPIAVLDPYHQLQVMEMLRAYAKNGAAAQTGGGVGGSLVVAVLHDLALAARFCSRVLLLDAGRVVVDDRPDAALTSAALQQHYRVEPFITRHDGQPLIVPWRRLPP